MKRDLTRLAVERFDVLVVGGGIHGAAAAREAASRGLATALIEQEDFGHATSANSLRILHGGLRYLQRADFGKFHESVDARRGLLRRFPHLAAPLPCLLPTHGLGTRSRFALAAGLALNEALSRDRNRDVAPACHLPRGRTVSRAELLRLAPGLDGARASGGALWYDALALDAERIVLELALDAAAAGAAVANRIRAEGFLQTGNRIEGVLASDVADGGYLEIRARVTIDATGPWRGGLEDPAAAARPGRGLAKAINVFVGRPIFGDAAVGIEGSGGRLLFFVPWRGATMIGTHYVPHTGPATLVGATAEEIAAFVREINRAHPGAALRPEEVHFAHAGLLPLAPAGAGAAPVETQLLQHPRVIDAARENGTDGLIGLVGVKYTTGLTVGARAVELAAAKLGRALPAPSPVLPTAGGPLEPPPHVNPELAERLARTYGPSAAAILADLATNGAHARRVVPGQPTTVAEILHAVREEQAATLADVVLRRTPLGTCGHPGAAALANCAAALGDELRWSASRRQQEIALVDAHYRRLTGR